MAIRDGRTPLLPHRDLGRGRPRTGARRAPGRRVPSRPATYPRATARDRPPNRGTRTVPPVMAPTARRRHNPAPRASGRGRIDRGMEWVETTGRTVAEAKDAALDQLGVDDADAEFVVVT